MYARARKRARAHARTPNPFHGAAWLKCTTVCNGQKAGKHPEHIRGLTDVDEHIQRSVALFTPKPAVNNLLVCVCVHPECTLHRRSVLPSVRLDIA